MAGFALPAILVVVGGLFILALGALLTTGIERGEARAFVDHQRAELAARAGLEEVRGILNLEAANDDFIVIQSVLKAPVTAGREPASYLFIARGKAAGSGYAYRYVPLFSTTSRPEDSLGIAPPEVELLVGKSEKERIDFPALPYQEKVRGAWVPIEDEQGRTVARYAYWVEDLQGKLDPEMSGNLAGEEQTHGRVPYPFPAPGLNPNPATDHDLPLDQIALFVVDPAASAAAQGRLGKKLIENRRLLVSPDSMLAAAEIAAPLPRDATGRLVDANARAVEENLISGHQSYLEQPLVPYAPGVDPSVAGKPKLNLNQLLAMNGHAAVNDMAAFIKKALPKFDERKGGFSSSPAGGDDYLKTLSANSIDYADDDSEPTAAAHEYRGLDAYPLMSEVALQVNYVGISNQDGRKIMTFRFKLFLELFNPTNQPASGEARLSYEVALPMDGIGAEVGDLPFDSPDLLSSPERSTHDLSRIDGRYWTRPVGVSLQPNQYRCYQFADVTYRMDVGPSSVFIPGSTPFSLNETRGASGLSLMWNGKVVERIESIVRQEGLISASQGGTNGGFRVGTAETITKAALPGHVYDDYYPSMYYNMGDPRITHYLRSAPLAENAYPQNSSPNRRNIRLNIYQNDLSTKPKVYARMLPSEWPDGGHNADVGSWAPGTSDKTAMTDPKFDFPYDARMEFAAPQIISNRGRFYSATELGRVFDPIMYAPLFASGAETNRLRRDGKMPAAGASWPDAIKGQDSGFYGGGNTLRIGRPEHPAFDVSGQPGLHAAQLLDLFHAGLSRSENAAEREGPVVRIKGHLNLNTASLDSLRALAAGTLMMDPRLARRTSDDHLGAPSMAPPTALLSLSAPTASHEADRIARAIVGSRPFASGAGLALSRDTAGKAVFGNRALYPDDTKIEWTDSAAEEVFARVYEGGTVRSRNFRVWIVAQVVAPSKVSGAKPEVLAEVRKVHTLFADPGERAADGSIIARNFRTWITSSNDF